MKINKSYKYRFYPPEQQQQALLVDMNAAHSLWNHMIFASRIAYEGSKSFIDYHKTLTHLQELPEFSYLAEANRNALTQKLRDLETAYSNFFRKLKQGKNFNEAGLPKFKSKKNNSLAIRYPLDSRTIERQLSANKSPTVYSQGEWIKPTKNVGKIQFTWTRIPKEIPKMITITKRTDGSWWLSFSVEEEVEQQEIQSLKTGLSVGIDFGMKVFATLSNGFQFNAPLASREAKAKLSREQRALNRKVKNSKRYNRQKEKLAKLHSKIANKRSDYIHKFTNIITNNFDVIAVETLDIKAMQQKFGKGFNFKLADVSISETIRQLEYKANWKDKQFVKIDKWFPSSKTCNSCGTIHNMPLNERTMNCSCGNIMDRDYNAAINIRTEGLRSLNVDALASLRTEQFRLNECVAIETLDILTKHICLEQMASSICQ